MKIIKVINNNVVSALDGNGEEALDIWCAHFCNGQCTYREIQTYWEKFNPEEFYNSNKS